HSGLEAELVTPTGAAIIASVAETFEEWPAIVPERIGWGAGTKGLPDRPNVVRCVLGSVHEHLLGKGTHVLLEANVDDMTGEVAAHALNRVQSAGAVDVWIVPCTMKKGRPGMVFSALSDERNRARVVDAILRETSTIGVRQTFVSRVELPREVRELQTRWGAIRIKSSGIGSEF